MSTGNKAVLTGLIDTFQTAIHLDPKSAYSWNRLGIILQEQSSTSTRLSRNTFQTAIQLDLRLAAPERAGQCLQRAKQYSHTIKPLPNRHIQLDPERQTPGNGLGNTESKSNTCTIEAFQTTQPTRSEISSPWNRLAIST